MKTSALILLLLAVCFNCHGQTNAGMDTGGVALLKNYMAKHVRYTKLASQNNFYGQVLLYFKVNDNKTVSDVEILHGIEYGLGAAVKKVLEDFDFKSVYIKPDEYTCSFKFFIQNGGDEVTMNDRVINPYKIFKNCLFSIDVMGYGVITHRTIIGERIGYLSPIFDRYNGRVHLLTINRYKTNKQIIKQADSLDVKTKETFNIRGKLLITESFYNAVLNQKTRFVYNADDNKIGEYTYRDGKLFNSQIYEYNCKKRLARKEDRYLSNGKINETMYQYTNAGLLLETFGTVNGNITNITMYIYNKESERIEEVSFDGNIKKQSRTTYTYDTVGNKTSDNHYSAIDSLNSRTVYKYDDKHRIIEQPVYSNDGSLLWNDTFKYNSRGDKIEEVTDIMNYNPAGHKSTFA